MKIGYARVSAQDQNLERQIQALTEAGVEKMFQEKKSGKNIEDRLALQEALSFVREGDILVVESLERLGRNYEDIINIIQRLDNENIGLSVLNLPILNQDLENPLLQKFIRTLIIQLYSWIGHNEREENKRKQLQGIKIAKEKGLYKGRPLKYSHDAKNPQDRLTYREIIRMLEENIAIKVIAEETGVTRDTVYRIKRELVEKQN